MSFIESEWLKEFHDQYLDYDHDYVVSKIQPCIRHQDWEIIRNDPVNRYRYLGVFEMADIGGVINLVDGSRTSEAALFSMGNFYKFLTETIKLSPDKLRITYCIGGSINHLTKGKYPLNKELPRDILVENWKRFGIKESQLLPDDTRDTLLSLNIFGLPTPWGYRNEILYEHQGKLLDIATFEYLYYRPVFNEVKIVDLKKWEHCFVVSAVGVERLLMVVNDNVQITDCGHIKPVRDLIFEKAKNQNDEQGIIFTEAARTIHRIFADCGGYDKLSKKRKEKTRSYFRSLFNSAEKLGIEVSENFLAEVFSKNAELQPHYPELARSVNLAVKEIFMTEERLRGDRTKNGGVAQE